ncbi:MAG: PAS domain S-box protein, partial [candidate division WOR-3 bacterium]
PKSKKIALEYFEKGKKGSAEDDYVVEVIAKDGSIIMTHLRVYTLRENMQFKGRFGIARDITKLTEMERKWKGSELRYQILFMNIPVGVFYYNTDLILTDFNDRLVKILRSSPEKLRGLNLKNL